MKKLQLKGWIVGLLLIAMVLSGCGSNGEGSVKNNTGSDSSGNSDGGGGSSGNSDGGEGSGNPDPTEPLISPKDLGFKTVMIDGGGITEQKIDVNGHLVDVPVENAGEATAVAVDSDSNGTTTVHITYFSDFDGALKHAWCTTGNDCSLLDSWQKEIVDQGSGPHGLGRDGNMAIDQKHQIHVSYRDNGGPPPGEAQTQSAIDQLQSDSNKILKYATNASGSWQSVIVDDTTDAVTYTHIKVDGNERIHISYKAENQTFVDSIHGIQLDNALYYATCSQDCLTPASTGTKSPAWTTVRVDGGWEPGNNNIYAEPNFTFVTDDAIHISYYASGTLKYATCRLKEEEPDSCKTVQEWSLGIVDDRGDVGRENSLSVNSDGVHITYRSLPEGNVKYAFCAADCTQQGNWTTITVDSNPGTGKCTQIKIDGQNRLHVIYGDSINNDLKYAFCARGCTDPSQWSLYLVDAPGEVGGDGYLALESDGPDQTVHVSYSYYVGGGNYALKYAFGSPPVPD